jgi:hypothetical protein
LIIDAGKGEAQTEGPNPDPQTHAVPFHPQREKGVRPEAPETRKCFSQEDHLSYRDIKFQIEDGIGFITLNR